MKQITILLLLIFGLAQLKAEQITFKSVRLKTPFPMPDIILTDFSKTPVYTITAFGARGDGVSDCSSAIRKAIDSCHLAGGGRVVVPAGRYLTGPIYLKSKVNLHLEKGATLAFSTEPADYLPLVQTRWEGVDLMNYSPLIYAFKEKNIAVSGEGVLDGQASSKNWWPWKGRKSFGWMNGMPNQTDSSNRPALFAMAEKDIPVQERKFGEGFYLRPQFIQPYLCENVQIEGVTIIRSPMWVIHPVLCNNVVIRNVNVNSDGPNADGCDPESCKNVWISESTFDTGDDCIAIKSGRNRDGRRINIPSENIVVQNCNLINGHAGIGIGSEIGGGVKNLLFENCTLSKNMWAVRVKTSSARGGRNSNIFIRNIRAEKISRQGICITMLYEDKGNFMPVIENIQFKNIDIKGAGQEGIVIEGYPESPVDKILLENVSISGAETPYRLSNIRNLTCKNTSINGEPLNNPVIDFNRISLNGIWDFKFISDSMVSASNAWYPEGFVNMNNKIQVPSNWEMKGFAALVYGRKKYDGTGFYKRGFQVPEIFSNQKVYIHFDGVLYGYIFKINGHLAGGFNSAFNHQQFDISPYVKKGENTIEVQVNRYPKGWEFDTNDCWSLSGIYRDVSLEITPGIHIVNPVIQTSLADSTGIINFSCEIFRDSSLKKSIQPELLVSIKDLQGNTIGPAYSSKIPASIMPGQIIHGQIKVDHPKPWTAETPDLYTIEFSVAFKNEILHAYKQKIGFREISWKDGVLKLNGRRIKLRGVNHHDLSPVNGRSMTEEEMLTDLKLIREANINFIRTSHYPPAKRFLELCDSIGFYVMDEVPFGYGDEHLNDTSYREILMQRARETVHRDINHPSVIAWSVGNENPLTDMCVSIGEYVHQLDSTRPHCFPQIGSYFQKIRNKIPASVDILTPHYPVPERLREFNRQIDKPMIVTEYAHALGLDFDKLESLWEIMYHSEKIAGGAIWHFFDQSLLQKQTPAVDPARSFTSGVWKDKQTFYNNEGNQGADGIVYADRTPQTDYWQVRKVYSPVIVKADSVKLMKNQQNIILPVHNRFDFTDLDKLNCRWTLFADTTQLQTGSLTLKCAPHDSVKVAIPVSIPEKKEAIYYRLQLSFYHQSDHAIYEKTIRIYRENDQLNSMSKLRTGLAETHKATKFPSWMLDAPYLRMGRKYTMSELATTGRTPEHPEMVVIQQQTGDPLLDNKLKSDKNPYWFPHLVKKPYIRNKTVLPNKISYDITYERPGYPEQKVEGKIEYFTNENGLITVSFKLIPRNVSGSVLEAGISFHLPDNIHQFRWIGMGPYPSYPGKSKLDAFGFYGLHKDDIHFQGNRNDIELAVFTDDKGNGFALIPKFKTDIAVENTDNGIIFSYNAFVSGRFNKGNAPEVKINASDISEISGSFDILPLEGQKIPVLEKFFGPLDKIIPAFQPFYHSYDQ